MQRYTTAALSVVLLVSMSPVARADIIGVSFAFLGADSQVVRIDPATGVGSVIGVSGFPAMNSLAANSAGTLFSVVDNPPAVPNLFTINPNTGAGALVATVNFGAIVPDVRGLAIELGQPEFPARLEWDAQGLDLEKTLRVATPEGEPPRLAGILASDGSLATALSSPTRGMTPASERSRT